MGVGSEFLTPNYKEIITKKGSCEPTILEQK